MATVSIFDMQLDSTTYEENTQPMLSHINVGSGVDCTIRDLAETVVKVIGYAGQIVWDTSKPDGAPRKLLKVDRLKKRWAGNTVLRWSKACKMPINGFENTKRPVGDRQSSSPWSF